MDIQLRIDDKTARPIDNFTNAKRINIRGDHELPAVEAILRRKQGIIQAPPGAGKTVICLEAIRQASLKSIVIVDKSNIAQQWVERAKTHIGIDAGICGDGEWDDSKPITIALQQTLWRRRESLIENGFFDRFGFVVLDECHRATAETYQYIMGLFSALYRIGASATPKKTGDFNIARSVIGEIINVTDQRTIANNSILVTPTIIAVETNFLPKHTKTKKIGKNVIRNNYSSVINHLVNNVPRNTLIASKIAENKDHVNLVVSRRKAHLENIKSIVEDQFGLQCFLLTGDEPTETRMEISRLALDAPCVVFSTIADEALDIPSIDRVYLPFPTRNTDLIIQQIGRGMRSWPGKKDCLVYDFYDPDNSIFQFHFTRRCHEVYNPKGFEVVRISSQ